MLISLLIIYSRVELADGAKLIISLPRLRKFAQICLLARLRVTRLFTLRYQRGQIDRDFFVGNNPLSDRLIAARRKVRP